MTTRKNKYKFLLTLILVIIGGALEGYLVYKYLPWAIAGVVLIPGFIAFFGETLGSVGKEKEQ